MRVNHWEIGVINKYIQSLPNRYNIDIKLVRDMSSQGFTRKEMAEKIKVPEHAIRYVCEKHAIKSRLTAGWQEKNTASKKAATFKTFLAAQLKGK